MRWLASAILAVVTVRIVCLVADSPGRDPHVISTSSHRSQSALGSSETGHRALVLKVQYIHLVAVTHCMVTFCYSQWSRADQWILYYLVLQ